MTWVVVETNDEHMELSVVAIHGPFATEADAERWRNEVRGPLPNMYDVWPVSASQDTEERT